MDCVHAFAQSAMAIKLFALQIIAQSAVVNTESFL